MKNSSLATAVAIALLSGSASAAVKLQTLGDALDQTEFSFGGYIKLDSFWSDYSDGKLSSNNIGRQFYVASTIPVCTDPNGCDDGDTTMDAHARTTRFNFSTATKVDEHTIKTFLEMDFMATPGGNERVSSSYEPRIRHAFFTYDNWLFGQTWTTFQNTAVLPEAVDFLGVSESTVFARQAMVRYTMDNWQFSLENPETTYTPYAGGSDQPGGGRIDSDDSMLPDAIVRYNMSTDYGSYSLSGLVRQLKYDTDGQDDTDVSYGLSFAGKVPLGKDDIRFMLTGGAGLGRYVGLNFINGGSIDDSGNLEAIDSVAGFVSYRHWWNDQWRSNFYGGAISADNDEDNTGMYANKSSYSAHANLMYSPVPKLTFGLELMYAERELESGDKGDMTRLQFGAKYAL
ncbi:porin [Corallincola luteus]|uniref:Porin n=2 Tax=Corallincola TaxID=1775176 RepID=A0A368NGI6_9GAMM|nr:MULTISPECIES: DcaP family trimeric outer membrane transporter [Corallincola]RCU48734.1 porin [Corallincola holothuriorum]TCI01721.1 porin [Corallincola luteus]